MTRGALGVLAVVAALGFTTAAGAAAADNTPDRQLLKNYQPVLRFHPNELLRPTKVKSFVADSELERLVGRTRRLLRASFESVETTNSNGEEEFIWPRQSV